MKKLLYLLVFSFYLLVSPASAQMLDPLKWSYQAKDLSETTSELVFTAKLDNGWHLYSQHTDPNGPIGIAFTFDKSADYELVGDVREPKPHEAYDKDFGCTVRSFDGTVVFRQKIKRKTDSSATTAAASPPTMCPSPSR